MIWSVAFKTLTADRRKLLTALVGVVFSVVLVNVQGGLFLGLLRKASLLVDEAGADIWVGHRWMHSVDFPEDIPRRWIDRIRGAQGVKRAEPYLFGYGTITLPQGFEPIVLVGCEESSLLGNAWSLYDGRPEAIREPYGVIVDYFDADKLGDPQLGDLREIGGKQVRVVARSEGILGFSVTPYVFTTIDRAYSLLHKPRDLCSYFLVCVDEGADPRQVCRSISARLPEAGVYTKEEYAQMSIQYWLKRTGLGISFGAATVLGLVVGMVVVSQTLYARVLDSLEEFATLKAMGASDWQLGAILFLQAAIIAALGSVVGLVISTVICRSFGSPRAPIIIPWYLSLGSCLVVYSICFLSSLVPLMRIRRIDVVEILQS
jgi:putative ABC transport system permease protein